MDTCVFATDPYKEIPTSSTSLLPRHPSHQILQEAEDVLGSNQISLPKNWNVSSVGTRISVDFYKPLHPLHLEQ